MGGTLGMRTLINHAESMINVCANHNRDIIELLRHVINPRDHTDREII